jgi:hypothetical protein
MLISKEKKFLFIHIPRTGGSSLREYLLNSVPDCQPLQLQHCGVHTEGEAFFEQYKDYCIFTVIRNPWERLYSWYRLMIKYQLAANEPVGSFSHFVTHHSSFTRMNEQDRFCFNQLDYIQSLSGQVLTNKIVRFEHYQDDINHLFEQLGLSKNQIPWLNAAEELLAEDDYTDACSNEVKDIVARLAYRDIEYFDYIHLA